MIQLLDVTGVKPLPDYILELDFENGVRRYFDMKPYLSRKPFNRLVALPVFMKASIDYGTVVWPGNIDIDPEILWGKSKDSILFN
jgi:hypothetical protein